MRFKRSGVRYSESPVPATPYQAAAQVWDERLGGARVQAKNWRLMAFGCLALAVLMAAGLVWQSGQSRVTPYVVEVDHAGQVRAVGEAARPYTPTDAQIAYTLAHFISDVRSLSIDPVVVRQDWLDAYGYTTDRGAATLNDYARAHDPFAHVGQDSVSVDVESVVRVSDASFQVRWSELHYNEGTPTDTEHWTAMLALIVQPPHTEQQLRSNPLGLYINGLSWSRDLDVNDGAKQP
jgi:type IV secretion system protein VirB5